MPVGMATTPLPGGMGLGGLDSPASTRNLYQQQRQYPYSPYHINTNITTAAAAAANNNNMMSDSRRGSRTENLISPLQQHPVTPLSSQSQRFPWRASDTFAPPLLLPQVQNPSLTLLTASNNNKNNNNIVNNTSTTPNYSHIPIPPEPLTPVHLSGYPGNPQRLSAASYCDETNSMYTSVAASSQYTSNGAQYATKLTPAPAPRRWPSTNTQSPAPVVTPQANTLSTVNQNAAPQQRQQTWFDSNSSSSHTNSSGIGSISHYSAAASLSNASSRLSEMQSGYGTTHRDLTSSPTQSEMVVPQRKQEQQYTIPRMDILDEAIDEVPPLRSFGAAVQRDASYQPQHQQPPPPSRPYSSSSLPRGSQTLFQYTWEQQQHGKNGEDGVPGDILRYSDPRGPYERSNFL